MKLKNRDVLTLFETIRVVDKELPILPAKVTYANDRNLSALVNAYNAVNKTRGKLVEKYGIKDSKSPVGYKLNDDNITLAFKDDKTKEAFENEFKPILEIEVDIKLYTFSIDYLDGVEINKEKIPSIGIYYKWLVVD